MDAKSNYFVWLIAYIDSAFIKDCQAQLDKHLEFKEVEAVIPTVKIIKKKFKGKNEFEEVPLLFNYGFFKVPRKVAIHKEFLEMLQQKISCIYGWVKDPLKLTKPPKRKTKNHKKPKKKKKPKKINREILDKHITVATATSQEVSELIRKGVELGIHNADDVNILKKGDYIVLKGYPFEGVEAEFISCNIGKKTVRVRIIIMDRNQEVEVSFDNVFFSIYKNKGYDDSLTIKKSLDEMASNNTLDHFEGKMKSNAKNE